MHVKCLAFGRYSGNCRHFHCPFLEETQDLHLSGLAYPRSSSPPTICAKGLLLGSSILPSMPCFLPLKLPAVPGSISPGTLVKLGVRTTCSMSISPVPWRYPWWEYLLRQRAVLPTGSPRLVRGHLWGCSGWDVRMERLTSRWHLLAGGIAFTLVSFHLQQYRTENPAVCCGWNFGTQG